MYSGIYAFAVIVNYFYQNQKLGRINRVNVRAAKNAVQLHENVVQNYIVIR